MPPPSSSSASSSVVADVILVSAFMLLTLHNIANAQESTTGPLRLLAEWKEIEYEFPSDQLRQSAIDTQDYVPGNGVSIDMDIDYGGTRTPRVFVTVPRFVGGIPITFGTLTNEKVTGGPLIRAYPNYELNANQGRNCDGLTSVFRVAIDDCRRLWVLDAGKVGDVQACPPQLVVFDLDTDRMVQSYKFPLSQYKLGSSQFITPIVDVRDPTPGTPTTCPNTMVYVADCNGFGLLMYDLKRNRSWRAQNTYVFPTPHAGTFTIAGESFDLMDGIFGMSLTPQNNQRRRRHRRTAYHSYNHAQFPSIYHQTVGALTGPLQGSLGGVNDQFPAANGERLLYFHTLASTTEIAVPLRVLDNSSMWEANVESVPRAFVEIGSRGTQSPAEAMDANGNLFFGLIDPIGIGCWDSHKPYGRDSIRVVAQNDETLQFSSGLKVKRNRKGKEELWVMTCRFQKVMTGTISRDEVNFRIQAADIEQLLGGQTRCSAAGGLPSTGFSFPNV